MRHQSGDRPLPEHLHVNARSLLAAQQRKYFWIRYAMVDDADAWWKRIEEAGLKPKYPGITAKPPTMQPWGLRVLYLTDPSGVLWHIADRRSA